MNLRNVNSHYWLKKNSLHSKYLRWTLPFSPDVWTRTRLRGAWKLIWQLFNSDYMWEREHDREIRWYNSEKDRDGVTAISQFKPESVCISAFGLYWFGRWIIRFPLITWTLIIFVKSRHGSLHPFRFYTRYIKNIAQKKRHLDNYSTFEFILKWCVLHRYFYFLIWLKITGMTT